MDFELASSYASGTINTTWTRGSGWSPIGNNSSGFTAIFEGNENTISNLFINRSSTSYIGLFGYIKGNTAELRNLGMVEVEVEGSNAVGGLVGVNDEGTVSGSYATGSVAGRQNRIGGLVGTNYQGTVSDSYATGAVTGTQYVGGLVGYNPGDISNSYATGAVTGDDSIGGLVGENSNPGNISNSYATGAVTGTNHVGGLGGYSQGGTVSNTYATGRVMGTVTGSEERVGGLWGGKLNTTITASYYNRQTTGKSDSGRGVAKTTVELLAPTSSTGIYGAWNGADWNFGTNLQYPVLKIDVNGNGTAGDPADLLAQRPLIFVPFDADGDELIEVSTLEQLNAIRYDLDGNGIVSATNQAAYSAAFDARVLTGTVMGYELINDLDFKNGSTNTAEFSIWAEGSSDAIEGGWEPIGDNSTASNDSRFTAIFEGNGHTISNLFIDRSSTNNVGLFGYVRGSSARLRNIGLLEVNVTGDDYVGGLVGINWDSTVSNSYATGSVTADSEVGGLVGSSLGDIVSSYATGSVTATRNNAGGLVGRNDSGRMVSNSYATGAVSGVGNVGGLVGENGGDISNSYATGSVTGGSSVGGLVGSNFEATVSNSYATGTVTGNTNVGGLVGHNNGGTVTASYYNSETTGQSDTGKGVAKTTAELLAPTGSTGIYQTWNATDWDFGTNEEYPVLKIDVDGNGTAGEEADLLAQRPPPEDAFIEVSTLEQLDAIRYDLDGNGIVSATNQAAYSAAFSDPLPVGTIRGYQLINDLDFELASSYASGTINTTWTTGSGWESIGDFSSSFTATFEGNGHTISNLFIDRSSTNFVGLFGGISAALRNIGLLEVEVTGNQYVGGMVGAV